MFGRRLFRLGPGNIRCFQPTRSLHIRNQSRSLGLMRAMQVNAPVLSRARNGLASLSMPSAMTFERSILQRSLQLPSPHPRARASKRRALRRRSGSSASPSDGSARQRRQYLRFRLAILRRSSRPTPRTLFTPVWRLKSLMSLKKETL
jgi:hypothetical protein